MKKYIFLITLITLIQGGIFAQEERLSNVKNNWISAELSLLGGGARYERMLNSNFSVGVYTYAFLQIPVIVYMNIGFGGNIRYYPTGRVFFMGLGFGGQAYALPGLGGSGHGITPEIGWKIDTGEIIFFKNTSRTFIQPGIVVPITLNVRHWPNVNIAPAAVPYIGLGIGFF